MKKNAWALVALVLFLFIIGLVMVFDTTSAEVLHRSLQMSTYHAVVKQAMYALLGIICATILWFIGYENVLRFTPILFYISIFFLILVFVPGIGQQINGAYRWIKISSFSFQPSEFVKIILPLYFIHEITTHKGPFLLKSFFFLLGKTAIPIGLILFEPDNGTVAIILCTFLVLFILSGIKWVYWALPLFLVCSGGVVAAMQMQHVSDRIRVYLHPELDLRGKGHQPYQAKIAAGSGKLYGRGLGESLQKLDYLPEARSDYIAAIYAEEFGFIGMLILIALYMSIAYCGFSIAARAPNSTAFYSAAIITFLITFQAFLNLGIVSGLLPSKGTTLPFFSLGGSSLLANFLGICLILNVTHTSEKKTCVK